MLPRRSSDTASEQCNRWPTALRALAHPNYQLFFAGQLVSLIGTWMQTAAQAWLLYRLTESAAQLGLIGFASQFPVFLLAPIGGVIADRSNRRRVLIVTQFASMLLTFALAVLTLAGIIQIWEIFLLAVLFGIVNAVDIPARQAFVADLVGRRDLINAVALNSTMFNGARIIGPALGGMLVATVGEGWCFFVNGISFLAVLVALSFMTVPSHERSPVQQHVVAHMAEGLAYAWRTRPVRALLALLGFISLVGLPYAVLMPVISDKILHSGPTGLGILMGSAGVGALAAALILTARKTLRGLGRWIFLSSVALGASLVLFSLSRHFWLSAGLLVPVGYSMMITMAASNTLLQAMVPDHLRGP